MAITFCVISHTHWDREWYRSFESFRIRLVDLIDHLLVILDRNPSFRFHLDAQTIVLEDYLEIRPDKEALLHRHITEGRILVGPWYIQNDFFLCSGESTIRNLLVGTKLAESFGRCMRVGYTPDQFGLISQLPQILKRSGLDTCVFGRGYSFGQSRKSEFVWETEDGSEVLAVLMPYWYNNAQRFSRDPKRSRKLVERIREQLRPLSGTDYLLLMNGVDHLEPQGDLLEILQELEADLPEGDRIFQDTMPEYLTRLRGSLVNPGRYRGAMRHGGKRNILSGTLSSRVQLKQWNARCQSLLEGQLEPLSAIVSLTGAGDYPADFLTYLWKLLMQNHAHDSICGCSVDAVPRHMMDRFHSVDEASRDLLERKGQELVSCITHDGTGSKDYLIVVVNTLTEKRDGVVRLDLDFPKSEGVSSFVIEDSQGHASCFDVLGSRETTRSANSPVNLPGYMEVTRFHIAMLAEEVPSMGYARWVVHTSSDGLAARVASHPSNLPPVVENRWLKAGFRSDGRVDLFDKETGLSYLGLVALEDREDVGDSYVYESAGHAPFTASGKDFRILEFTVGSTCQSLTGAYSILLPERYLFAMNRRSHRKVRMPVEVNMTLNADERFLRISIGIDNKVRDHRIQVVFATGAETPISRSGSPFDSDVHAREEGLEGSGHPLCGFVDVSVPGRGLAVLTEGLYEYAHPGSDSGELAVTLLRGNGFVHKDEAEGSLGDEWNAPENQCLGKHHFQLAILPHDGTQPQGWIPSMWRRFASPLLSFYHAVDRTRFSVFRPFIQDVDIQEVFYSEDALGRDPLPSYRSLLETDSPDMILSCFKKAEERNTFILRLYNVSDVDTPFRLRVHPDISSIWRTDLMERRVKSIPIEKGSTTVECVAKPKEIMTFELVTKTADVPCMEERDEG